MLYCINLFSLRSWQFFSVCFSSARKLNLGRNTKRWGGGVRGEANEDSTPKDQRMSDSYCMERFLSLPIIPSLIVFPFEKSHQKNC